MHFYFSLIKYLVAMNVNLLLALFFGLLLGMLIGVGKRAGYWHTIDDEEYKILKHFETTTGSLLSQLRSSQRVLQRAVIKFWNSH